MNLLPNLPAITSLLALLCTSTAGLAQSTCLDSANLLAMDIAWETALRDNDVEWLDSHLADNFIWVHNHASATDTKPGLITRAKDPEAGATGNPISRTSHDVQVFIHGHTAIVTGYTTVKRERSEPHYNFMRTYTETDGKCLLLGNHTMQLNQED